MHFVCNKRFNNIYIAVCIAATIIALLYRSCNEAGTMYVV